MKKQIVNIYKLLSFTIIIFILMFSAQTTPLEAGEKDYILVLDTSLSMTGKGGRNILPTVKKSVSDYIDEQLEEDDSITIITFDTDVKVHPTYSISDENAKNIVKGIISMVEAKGKWTYTSLMIKKALKKALDLEKEDEDRQQIIVVMTDTLDDPPPWIRRDRRNIKEIAKPYKEKGWFFYWMKFGELKKDKKIAKELENITKYTKLIDTKKGTKKEVSDLIEKNLKKDIEKMAAQREAEEGSSSWLIFLIIFLIAGAGIFVARRQLQLAKLKVTGKLEYWDHTVIAPYNTTYDLTRQNLREIAVGRKGHLKIEDLDITDPFIIESVRDEDEIKNSIQAGKNYNIEFVNRDPGKFLQNGDMFKVANYTFKYME